MSENVRPRLRKEQQAATRQRLLDAARSSFIESGFIATTIDEIVDTAGTSRATFYLHFKSKSDALAHTWAERDLPEVDALFVGFDRAGDFSLEASLAWVDDVVAYWEKNAGVARAGNQALSLDPDLGARWLEGMTGVANDMTNLRALIGPDPEENATRLLTRVIQMERTLYFWTNNSFPHDRDHLIRALAREWAILS